jgi:hypothetical protein
MLIYYLKAIFKPFNPKKISNNPDIHIRISLKLLEFGEVVVAASRGYNIHGWPLLLACGYIRH